MVFLKAFGSFFKHHPAETLPVIGVTVFGVAICALSLGHTWKPAKAQWTVKGQHPELKIKQGEKTKFMAVNQKYTC
eukprot:CFRG0268T1